MLHLIQQVNKEKLEVLRCCYQLDQSLPLTFEAWTWACQYLCNFVTFVSLSQKMLAAPGSHRALTKYPGCKNIY